MPTNIHGCQSSTWSARQENMKGISTSMGPQPAMDLVRRSVWGMMYADDACIFSRSPQGLIKMMEITVEFC